MWRGGGLVASVQNLRSRKGPGCPKQVAPAQKPGLQPECIGTQPPELRTEARACGSWMRKFLPRGKAAPGSHALLCLSCHARRCNRRRPHWPPTPPSYPLPETEHPTPGSAYNGRLARKLGALGLHQAIALGVEANFETDWTADNLELEGTLLRKG